MTDSNKTCPVCGAVLQKEAPGGLCPKCLMEAAVSESSDLHEPSPNEDAVSQDPSNRQEGSGFTKGPQIPFAKIRYFGDYELLEEIGRGAVGVVFKAKQLSLNRPVALKIISVSQLASPTLLQQLHTEAEAVANLDHPNIVPIYEVGEHEGYHYFSMKLIEPGSFAQRMSDLRLPKSNRNGDPRSRERQVKLARLVAKVAWALHYAHQRGILHRDVKPGNILIDQNGEPHVADFGLAKRIEGEADLTSTGGLIGTPRYMAPERIAEGDGFSITADVYSLGAVLYELMVGKPPFDGESPWQIVSQMEKSEPMRPRQLNPSISTDLETIVLKCLEREPEGRYTSAAALAEDLERWVNGNPIQARPGTTLERTWKWARRKPVHATLSGVLILDTRK